MPARTDAFSSDGFVVVRDAIAPDVIRRCVEAIEDELCRHGVDPRDRTTWTEPVVRLACPEGPAFAEAGTSPALRAAYDELLGPGRWIRREGVGGTLPVRFPSLRDPGDAGWHIDGSYDVDGAWWANVRSRGRGLLALFLFTDVSDDDAPTELIVGSHLDVPRVLAPFGERGVFYGDVVPHLPLHLRAPSSASDRTGGRRLPLPSVSCSSRNVAASRRRTAHGGSAGGGDPGAIHVARRSRPVPRRASDPARPRGEVAVTAGQPLAACRAICDGYFPRHHRAIRRVTGRAGSQPPRGCG